MPNTPDLVRKILADTVNGTISPPTAASKLTAPIKAAIDGRSDDSVEELLWDTFGTLAKFAAETAPEKQDALVAVFAALQKQPSGNTEFTVWGETVTLNELPLWGAVSREEIDHHNGIAFVNFNAFLAKLVAAKEDPDSALYGLSVLRQALEDDRKGVVHRSNDIEEDALLASAAVWFVYAGAAIRQLSEKGEAYPDRLGVPGTGIKRKNWKGFNKERYAVWVDTFKKANEAGVAGEAKDLVAKAVAGLN